MKSLGFKACCILSLAVSSVVYAGETGHYVNGVEGIKAASVPPPGLYYLMYNVFYNADSVMDQHGNELNIGFDASIYAMVNRFVWISDHKILGADYGMDMVVPLINTNVKVLGNEDEQFGLGDIYIEPLILRWAKERYDISAAAGLYLPTGDHGEPASPGKDFWTGMFTLGGTYYFDEDKTWSGSILARYEIHSEKDDVDVKPGNDFHFEWGIGKTVAPGLDLGITGYAQWQISDDSGSDVTWDKAVHDQVFAVGPEAKLFIPSLKSFVSFRSQWEFDAEDRSEGYAMCLTFIKMF
ncbi:transporter [Candidatus Halobeggiatoa sp. HSG11]|nr:transporter [Candidatus Halobeggiatoa sp. HSG11]